MIQKGLEGWLINSPVVLGQVSSPTRVKTNTLKFYCKDDGGTTVFCYTDDTGVEHCTDPSSGFGGGGGHEIRENGVAQTARTGLNFIDTDAGAGLVTDDAGGDETELNLQLYALLTGRSGGQILKGGTGSGDDLTLRSTSHATKGDIFVADEGGNVIIGGGTTASRLRLREASGSGSNYTEFVVQPQTGDITYTLPPDDGDAGEVLTSNGSGSLTWESAPSGIVIQITGRSINTVFMLMGG